MATASKLLSLLGKPITGAALRGVIARDKLKLSNEPDLKEGQPDACAFIGKKVCCCPTHATSSSSDDNSSARDTPRQRAQSHNSPFGSQLALKSMFSQHFTPIW